MLLRNPYLRAGLYFSLLFSLIGYLMGWVMQPEYCGAYALQERAHERPVLYTNGESPAMTSLDEYDWTVAPAPLPHSLLPALPMRPDVELPTWPGCTETDYEARLECTMVNMVEFIRKHVQPMEGRRGRIIALYDVTLDGRIINSELYEGTDPALTAETMRLVGIMQGADLRFTPGKVNGEQQVIKLGIGIAFGGGCQGCAANRVDVFQLRD